MIASYRNNILPIHHILQYFYTATATVNNISENIDESGFVLPDGYRFGGWYKTRDCEGEPVSVEENLKFSEVKHGATYYARWIKA